MPTRSTPSLLLAPGLEPPRTAGPRTTLSGLIGCSGALAIAELARHHRGVVLAVTADSHAAARLEQDLELFLRGTTLSARVFPDWETLPYDVFSPHQDIVSNRLAALSRLPQLRRGVLIVPVATLMQRLPPRSFLDRHVFLLRVGERIDREALRARLDLAGYGNVSLVAEHGDFAVRGSLIDLFPMGAERPYRIDLFDDEVESIRPFDPETQLSADPVSAIELLPAREFPLDKPSIARFRRAFRQRFPADPKRSLIYREVSKGNAPGGCEYYLPLFFEDVATLFDYLSPGTLVAALDGVERAAAELWEQVAERYEQRRHDLERPVLPPEALYLDPQATAGGMAGFPGLELRSEPAPPEAGSPRAPLGALPVLTLRPGADRPAAALQGFLEAFPGRVLLCAESPGHRELLRERLNAAGLYPEELEGWQAFVESRHRLALTVAPIELGFRLADPELAIVAEPQLHGDRAPAARRRRAARDAESVIRDLTDLNIGAPVVHEEHGVGRYAGLQQLSAGGVDGEYAVVDYAEGGRLYVPVASLQRLSRFTGAEPETAPLHKLGSDQWQRAKRKAAQRVTDAAAELLDLYARRQARPGHAFAFPEEDYAAFAAAFPFDETPDQEAAIEAVLDDLRSERPMDRVVCGDVGFGKTEVAMRAAFVAVQGGRQVAVLVPTTLLAQQHHQNFLDRYADWPVRVEMLSRFRSRKEQEAVLAGLASGTVDIVIGTHRLLQPAIRFRRLGLLVVDEEHRFGVRHKERLKEMRAEVDMLTLTATPIPRTLNMAMSGIRDLSIITTPPAHRLSVRTFVAEWDRSLLQEACLRELKRGGQVYFLHNEVESIERQATQVRELVPGARVAIAHGQMRERELEQVMLDFYHQRSSILVCSTIIESGIDVPTANTIVINRADKLGLAQLHQLRGRVGRSHHRAYAYLVVPPRKAMTADAVKRIEAVEALGELGAGFMLANHDLEIRGAGELLGEEQSGQIQEIGFGLYLELLDRAVKALRAGEVPDLDRPLDHGPEVDLRIPALIPEDYLPDVHARLILYKRIASAASEEALRDLQVEMIDRFGLLPEPVKALFRVAGLKLRAVPIGVRKIEVGPEGGRIVFQPQPRLNVERLVGLLQTQSTVYRMDGQERLRIEKALPDGDARLREVEGLLEAVAA